MGPLLPQRGVGGPLPAGKFVGASPRHAVSRLQVDWSWLEYDEGGHPSQEALRRRHGEFQDHRLLPLLHLLRGSGQGPRDTAAGAHTAGKRGGVQPGGALE